MAVLSVGEARARYAAAGAERVALRRLAWVGPLAVAAATAASEVARRLLLATLQPIGPDFLPMQAEGVALMTVAFAIAAVAVFAAVARLSIQPIRTYQIVAAVALALSMLPDLMLLQDPTATAGGVVALMILHVVAAAAIVWPLSTLTRAASSASEQPDRTSGPRAARERHPHEEEKTHVRTDAEPGR
jgi:Family of unknown function (DUF6069)